MAKIFILPKNQCLLFFFIAPIMGKTHEIGNFLSVFIFSILLLILYFLHIASKGAVYEYRAI